MKSEDETVWKKLRRLLRYDWPLHVCLTATNWLPDNVVFLRLRGWLAHWFLGRCGSNLRLWRNVTLYNASRIFLGSDVAIALGCWLMAGADIRLEDGVMLGPYCVVVSSNHTRWEGSFRFGARSRLPIRIGRGSWLGAHSTVLAGASVGCGVAVGANSVVRGEIPDHVVAAGAPARVIRPLDDDARADQPARRAPAAI